MTHDGPDAAADRRAEAGRILLVGGALAVVAGAWVLFLRHRTDYPGHLLAGYGATLGALGLLPFLCPREAWGRIGPALVTLGTLTGIVVGLGLEATVFRIAAFDPVDACNQSLGAAVAGLSVLFVATPDRPPPATVAVGVLLSIASTAAGFLLAFH
jgi:hypothetical protein